jgi:hypothetical protein
MHKNIQIIENSSGRIVAQYPIIIELIDTSDKDYFNDAWENAVEEGLVDEENRDNYDIEIVDDTEELTDD